MPGIPYHVPLVLASFLTLSNLRIWEELFKVCSFYHQSALESDLFVFCNWWRWVYIASATFLEYPLYGDDCGMWGWGLGKSGKYHSESWLLRETNVTRLLWFQTLHWQRLSFPSQERGIGTGTVGPVPDSELLEHSCIFYFVWISNKSLKSKWPVSLLLRIIKKEKAGPGERSLKAWVGGDEEQGKGMRMKPYRRI